MKDINLTTDVDITLTDDQIADTNNMIFNIENKEVLKIGPSGFFYKGERVDDVHDVYNRFNEWLTTAENKK